MMVSGVNTLVHRFSYTLAYGEIPNDLKVCHHCDNKPCVRPSHLFLGTQKENLRDMARKHRQVFQVHPERARRGETHCRAKVTEAQVIEARRLFEDGGVSKADLARRLGINYFALWDILKRRNWQHVH